MVTKSSKFGEEIARELLSDREALAAPRVSAEEFVKSILSVSPKAKLPAILAKENVKNWMAEEKVTPSILREAFSAARKNLRQAESETFVKRPKKRRVQQRETLDEAGATRLLDSSTPSLGGAPTLFNEFIVPN
ncbi:hypothetical protein [Sphingobium bisphenolivorans]|uniref:hypothetical protein n=1 Tax=Sphingobium bisphenolivorans TaxID=1335760 RepID=UPI00126A6DE5|nr:hypothetical protein [Sphingobium bisphenolivorans]